MRNTGTQVASSPFAAAAHPSFVPGGRITELSVRKLAGGSGLVLAYRRELDHAPAREEGWPLAGGLWGLGAASIMEVLPQVPDTARLDEGINLAERLVSGHQTRGTEAQHLSASGLEQAFELLGISNRQIRLYARENFLMMSGVGRNLDYCDLITAALRSRATADRLFFDGGPTTAAPPHLDLDGAFRAVVDGGQDAGLSYADARQNSLWILQQLDVFTGPADSASQQRAASEADLAGGRRTLSSQLSRQIPLDDNSLASELAQQLNVATGDAGRPGPSREAASEATAKRSRGTPLEDEAGEDRLSKRSRTTSNSSVSDEWVAGSLPLVNFTTLRMLSSHSLYGAMRSDWLTECKTKLGSPPPSRGDYPSASALNFLLGTTIRKRLVAPGTTLEQLTAQAETQQASGNFARVGVLRNEAMAMLRRYLHSRNALRDAAGLAHLARAELVPLPYAEGAAHETGFVIKSASGNTVVAYNPGAFALLDPMDDESIKASMRAMLKLLIAQRINETCLDSVSRGNTRGLTLLSSHLVSLVADLKFPPAPSLREVKENEPAQLTEKMSGIIIESLADALTSRVLGQTPLRPATPQQMDWRAIVAIGLEQLCYQPSIYHGLLGLDHQARSAVFESIFKSALNWLKEARPELSDPMFAPFLLQLVDAGNAGRIRKKPFSWDTVIERVIDNFWSFIRSPHRGEVTPESDFTPLQDHPIGYIQSAVIGSLAATRKVDEAYSIINGSVLALLSRDVPATQNLLRALVGRAESDPRAFATIFLCDIGDADDDAGHQPPSGPGQAR